MPQPYPGQQWKHGWIPMTGGAAKSKNHGRKPKPGSAVERAAAKASGERKPSSTSGARERSAKGKSDAKPKGKTDAPSKATPKPTWPTGKKSDKTTAKAPDAPRAPTKDKAFLDEHYGEWRNNLSPAQDKAMRFYQSPGFALMNGQLRGLDRKDIKADVSFNDSDLERARKASKDLTSAIKKAPPLKEPMTVFRGFSADQFGDLKAGAEISDKGFVSTSLTNDVGSVGKAGRQATAEIVLPKGTRAAAGSSREMVLPPGSKFRVHSVATRKGVPHYRMELVL